MSKMEIKKALLLSELTKKKEQLQLVLKNYEVQYQAIFFKLNVHPSPPINWNDQEQQTFIETPHQPKFLDLSFMP